MPGAEAVAGRSQVAGVRLLLVVFAVLTPVATTQLLVFSRRTAEGFAWTVQPPLTAAFLGAGYAAGFVLVVLSLRARTWGSARVGYVTVLVFALAALAATLLHLDRFHLAAAGAVPRAAAWGWLAVYVVVPVAMLAVLPGQLRAPGGDPRSGPHLGRVLRTALGAHAVVLTAAGAALFTLPAARGLWPWTLTPLTARAVASWLLALGLAAVLVVVDDDLHRLQPAAATYVVLGVLQLAVLVRFREDVAWARTSPWVYLLAVLSVLALGTAGLLGARRRPVRPAVGAGR
ncbi:hypothetical protein GTQ99_05740 [Kineococcus sp. T13]|uniref:hypothetical protein n=1 Tax=Kineococcus vitellinus TaxID=2696565 RepID=UPI0014133A8D|nr:hypothetical protein [Kineococcus vitellinus]NAZ74926.1 hypothetical protein [Kineococcus vitellinus]